MRLSSKYSGSVSGLAVLARLAREVVFVDCFLLASSGLAAPSFCLVFLLVPLAIVRAVERQTTENLERKKQWIKLREREGGERKIGFVAGLEGAGSGFKCVERERKEDFRREINAGGPNFKRERLLEVRLVDNVELCQILLGFLNFAFKKFYTKFVSIFL